MRYVLYFLFFVTVSCSQDAYPEFEERKKVGTQIDRDFQRDLLLRDTAAFRSNMDDVFLYLEQKTVFVYSLRMANMANIDIAYVVVFNSLSAVGNCDAYDNHFWIDSLDDLSKIDAKTRLLTEIYLHKLSQSSHDYWPLLASDLLKREGLTNYDSLKNEFIREYSK